MLVLIAAGALFCCCCCCCCMLGAGLCLVGMLGCAAFNPFPWFIAANKAPVSSTLCVFSNSDLPADLASISSRSLVISLRVSFVILSITVSCFCCWSVVVAFARASKLRCLEKINNFNWTHNLLDTYFPAQDQVWCEDSRELGREKKLPLGVR